MFLLDTSTLIDLPRVRIPDGPLVLSALTYAELSFGVERARTSTIRRERVARRAWLRDALGSDWLPFDTAAADGYGRLAAIVARTRPSHARSKDIMLAGHAHSLGASLVTLNPKDFDLVADEVDIVVPELR